MASTGDDLDTSSPNSVRQELLRPHSSKVAPLDACGILDEDPESPGEWDKEGLCNGDKEFRRRRLTFATQRNVSSNVCAPEVSALPIYRALELGEENIHQVAPFPASMLGIYSCHGAEPGWEEGEEDLAKINQDRACVVHPFMGSETCALLCVYDGHGESGDMVSNYVMNEMPNRLAGHPRLHDNPELALQETFEEVDKALREAAKDNEHVYSGTTAAVVLYRDDRVWVANAGDSRVVLGTEKRAGSADGSSAEVEPSGLVPVALSDDHNPDKPEELERIESCGGFVSPPPEEGLSARVWLDQELTRIGLAMSRSIGDHAVKEVGVIATPEIKVRSISEGDAFLVLASDGVWEFMGNQQVWTWTSIVSPLLFTWRNLERELRLQSVAGLLGVPAGLVSDQVSVVRFARCHAQAKGGAAATARSENAPVFPGRQSLGTRSAVTPTQSAKKDEDERRKRRTSGPFNAGTDSLQATPDPTKPDGPKYPRRFQPGREGSDGAKLPVYVFLEQGFLEEGVPELLTKDMHAVIVRWWASTVDSNEDHGFTGNPTSTGKVLSKK